MGRNTPSYHLSALPLLLVWLAFFMQCDNSQFLPHFLSPNTQATVRSFLITGTQHLHNPTNNLRVKQDSVDTGIVIEPGEEIFIQNTFAQFGNQAIRTCPASQTLPEAAFPCNALLFSIGPKGAAGIITTQKDFIAQESGNLFLGVNAPQNTPSDAMVYKVTVLTVPQGSTAGLWKNLQNNFLIQGENALLSMQAFGDPDLIKQVQFTATTSGKTPHIICNAARTVGSIYTCEWNLAAIDAQLFSAQTTLGFQITTTTDQHLINPDGQRYGKVRYITQQISSNYAGYAAQLTDGGNFSNVVGSWTMPAIHCAAHETSEAAFWVGLTGQSQQNTIAQIATLGVCQDGQIHYEADWELFPALAQTIPHLILPGDAISATVSYTGGLFTLALQDTQQNWFFSVSRPGNTINATIAECITEAPTLIIGGTQRSITNLANFGQVNMSCQANNAPVGNYGQLSQYQMIAENATASPSVLSGSDGSFNVTWQGK